MPRRMSAAGLRRAAAESVAGLPRAFWWLWTSTLVNRLGAFVATFLAMYLTVERGYSASYAGLVAALHGLGGAVSVVVSGVLTDRLGRRPTLLVSQVSTALAVATLGFMEHPFALAAVACLVGMTSNASRPAVQAMMADIVAPEDRVRAFSLNYWAVNLGFAISSAAAGLIAEHGYLLLFLGEAAMTLICAVVVFLKLPESRPGAGEGPVPGEGSVVSEGAAVAGAEAAGATRLATVLRDGRFMSVVGLSFLIATLIQQAFVALPVAMGAAGFSSGDFGMAVAVNGVLIVVLQIPVTRFIEHRDPGRLLVVSALLTGYGFGLTAFAGSVAFYALAVCVWTLGEIITTPTQMGLVIRLSPVDGRGRYQGIYSLSWSVAALTAPLMGGFVIDHYGADTLWGLSAVIGTVAAAGYWSVTRRLRDLPDLSPAPAPVPTPVPAREERPASGDDAREDAKEEDEGEGGGVRGDAGGGNARESVV